MQHATLTGRDSTGRTRNGGYLFGGEFFLFHSRHNAKISAAKQFNFAHYSYQLLAIGGPLRFPSGARFNSVVQDNTQEGIVHVDRAFVLDKA